jgi:hypothetical protein
MSGNIWKQVLRFETEYLGEKKVYNVTSFELFEGCWPKKNNLLLSNIILFAYRHKKNLGLRFISLPVLPTQKQGWGAVKYVSQEKSSTGEEVWEASGRRTESIPKTSTTDFSSLYVWGSLTHGGLRTAGSAGALPASLNVIQLIHIFVTIPASVTGIFHWHNPSVHTMALRQTYPLTEMSTRIFS